MPLEALKELVMQQAKEKGFGTTPAEIDVAQKLLLVMDEGMEDCLLVARMDAFDIENAVYNKVSANKARQWDPSMYNERFVQKSSG